MFQSLYASSKNPIVPGRNNKDIIRSELSGFTFEIAVPPTSTGFASTKNEHNAKIDLYNLSRFTERAKYPHEVGLPRLIPVFTREPTLRVGLLGGSAKGFMTISSVCIYFDDLPEGKSLLHPKTFESAVLRTYYFFRGPGSLSGGSYEGPWSWKSIKSNSRNWICFDTTRCDEEQDIKEFGPDAADINRVCKYYMPLTDSHMLALNFVFTGYSPASHCLPAMHSVKEEVFSSLYIANGNSAD